MTDETLYDQVVFSGGGLRCMWQGGFLHVLRRERPIAPARVIGVSGGALSVAGFLSDRGTQVRDTMMRAFAATDANVDLNVLDDPEDRLTPHQRIYREVVDEVLDDDAQAKIAEGPACQILVAHPPSDDWPEASGVAATLAYEAELHLVSSPHFSWAEKFGLTPRRIDANAAARDRRLPELVAAAATIPPIFIVPTWDGRAVVDGGMADQAPMPEPDAGTTLVLLTRRYRNLPDVQGRRYVTPSDETPVDKIDFTDPDKLARTWDLGERDAREFLRRQ